jgi:UDPglucose--hexose-1-phosphate uridylyltransferase
MAAVSHSFARPVHRLALVKPDGRDLILYARTPLDPSIAAPAAGQRSQHGSHVRWHPLLGQWVVYAGHRQNRTFLPPPEWNPLAPTVDPDRPTEVPSGAWEIAVFENLFSALGSTPADAVPHVPVASARCGGRCEVVVFTQDASASLSTLPLDRLDLVLAVWAERTAALALREDVQYVFPFENRGVEVGVTLHHPHGQIYAYPFVPPVADRELSAMHAHHQLHGRGLLEDMIESEIADGRRTLEVSPRAIAWVPACARWAYEVWIAPRRPVPRLDGLTAEERFELARALQIVLRKLDRLWSRPMPYVLAVHQAPTFGEHPYAHVHIEIYGWLRMPGRLKYLAGSEIGAGTFTADTLPEDKAAELRAVEVEP